MCRFINADTYASTGQGILGNNMFAYCNNTPVNGYDPCGTCIHNWKFYNCEKCDKFWNGVGEWCVDAYNSINAFHQQQAHLEAEMRMLQYEMVANTAKAIGDAYMQGCKMQHESMTLEAKLMIDMFDTPEDIERSIDIIETTLGFELAVYEIAVICVTNPTAGAVFVAVGGAIWGARALYRTCM